jgi:hypothetical protein
MFATGLDKQWSSISGYPGRAGRPRRPAAGAEALRRRATTIAAIITVLAVHVAG